MIDKIIKNKKVNLNNSSKMSPTTNYTEGNNYVAVEYEI